MINRNVDVNDMSSFDWFNDSKDTANWLRSVGRLRDAENIERMHVLMVAKQRNQTEVTSEAERLDAEYAAKMVQIASEGPEEGHMAADDLLCELLVKLGCQNTVEVFKQMKKWYS